MIVDPLELRSVLMRACRDAAIEPATCVVWIVDAPRPEGSTPIAYLQPAGAVRRDTVQVFRAVGAERTRPFEGSAHRFALWHQQPGLPEAGLGPMLRHELAHAVRWEESGTLFYEADERLRVAAGGSAYSQLPTEREANAAAAAYARRTLTRVELAELAATPELAGLLAASPPADVVRDTLALLGEDVEIVRAYLEPQPQGAVIEVVEPVAAAGSLGSVR